MWINTLVNSQVDVCSASATPSSMKMAIPLLKMLYMDHQVNKKQYVETSSIPLC